MRFLTGPDLDRLLDFPTLIGALETAFACREEAPERHHHAVGGGGHGGPMHLLMPAWTRDTPGPGSYLGVKIVNVFPNNGHRDLPAVLGTYLLHSGETGEPLVAMDGTRLTQWRTAAASGLAARYLARADAGRLLMVGAGALAPFLVRAHAAVRPVRHVAVWNRNRAGAERLAAALAGDGRWTLEVVDDFQAAAGQADIISCATLSTVPLLHGAWLRPGTHVDLVGAFTMGMREVDDDALARARVFVDTPAALTEGGDVALGLRAGAIGPGDVVGTLFDLCGGAPGRQGAAEITLFKSVGTAIEDLAAAMLAWRESGA